MQRPPPRRGPRDWTSSCSVDRRGAGRLPERACRRAPTRCSTTSSGPGCSTRKSIASPSATAAPGARADVETTEFVHNPFGHGWHVRRPAFDESLRERLRTLGVRVRSGARVAGHAWMGDHWRIGLDDPAGTAIRARAIVDATGRGARIARSQGAHRRRLDRLVAAYWLLDGQPTHRTTSARRWLRRSRTAGGTPRRCPGVGASWPSSPTPI